MGRRCLQGWQAEWRGLPHPRIGLLRPSLPFFRTSRYSLPGNLLCVTFLFFPPASDHGDMISPLTFNFFPPADDLKLFLQCSSVIMSMFSAKLQHNTNILSATSSSWGLEFSPNICPHTRMQFSRSPTPAGLYFYSSAVCRSPQFMFPT